VLTVLTSADPVLFLLATSVGGMGGTTTSEVTAISNLLANSSFSTTVKAV